MRLPIPRSRVSSLLALLTLTGCNAAYREAMSQARDAAVRGDFMTAAHAYRAACAADPNDETACSRVPIFNQKATDQAMETARPACDAGDLDRCVPPLRAAWDLLPNHPGLTVMLEKASQLHIERCAAPRADGSLDKATAELACLQSRGPQFPLPGFQGVLTESAQRLSARFSELAVTARDQGSAGAASVLLSAAQCLAPRGERAEWVQAARHGFLAQSTIPVATRLDGSVPQPVAQGLSHLCERLASGLPAAARCVGAPTAPGPLEPLELRVDALIQLPLAAITDSARSLRYVASTRQVANPDYPPARQGLQNARNALGEAEQRKKDKDADCKKEKQQHEATCVDCPPRKSACDEAKELADSIKRLKRERDAASSRLSNTPETLTENLYEDFHYNVRTHRWTSSYRFTLQASTPSTPPVQQEGQTRFEDQEHVGFSPGKLQPDPLVVPPPQAYADAFLEQLSPHVLEAVRREGQVRGAARMEQCKTLPAGWGIPWVQCWAEATLWSSGETPPPTSFLQFLATSAGAPAQPRCR
jgi:hypothetical protein